MLVRPFDQTLLDRFWAKVDRSGDCWIWTAGRNRTGRGNFWFMGRTVGAHQMAYELEVGEVPEGLCVLHTCDNGHLGCVRPDHLFLGTHKDNSQDMVVKGRHASQQVTQCPKGHPYDEENTKTIMHSKTGSVYRVCRQCHRERNRKGVDHHSGTPI